MAMRQHAHWDRGEATRTADPLGGLADTARPPTYRNPRTITDREAVQRTLGPAGSPSLLARYVSGCSSGGPGWPWPPRPRVSHSPAITLVHASGGPIDRDVQSASS